MVNITEKIKESVRKILHIFSSTNNQQAGSKMSIDERKVHVH